MKTSDQSPLPRNERVNTGSESYLAIVSNLVGLLAGVVVLLVVIRSNDRPSAPPSLPGAEPPRAIVALQAPEPVAAEPEFEQPAKPVKKAKPKPKAAPTPAPAPTPKPLDRVAVAAAEQRLDAASRDRARAEARADDAARRLADATAQAALASSQNRKLALRVRNPGTQLASLQARGGFLKQDRDRLKAELNAVAAAPRPKARSLVLKNPVAKPSDGTEYHFEVRRNRVTFIDLDRLLEHVKADAKIRIRMSDRGRVIESKVGPVGPFSIEYILGRGISSGIEELLMDRPGISYDLRGWELVPEYEQRGETYEQARQPISQFSLAVSRISPSKGTITMWVYPDGFELYRKLRDGLHDRGFTVAARPLPDGMAIRGSPAGSVSAGQ